MSATFRSNAVPQDLSELVKTEITTQSPRVQGTTSVSHQIDSAPNTVLSLKDGAKKLSISVNTLRNWCALGGKYSREGAPPIRKIGPRRVGIVNSDIDKFIAQCKQVG